MKLLLTDISIGKTRIPLPVLLWFTLAIIAVVTEMSRGIGEINNYLIYRGVWQHTISQQPLFRHYPQEYADSNHYGPVFSLLIAPFALLPVYIGCFLWCVANAWVLFYAIRQLKLSSFQQNCILLIAAIEMMTAIHSVQFNPMLTGWILLSYTLSRDNRVVAATFFIAAGILVKLYGIVGLSFFLFTDRKTMFIVSFIGWMILLFALPMLIASPTYIINTYVDWFHSLVEKNASNVDISIESGMQDISVGGMIRRIFYLPHLPNYFVTIPAGIGCLLPLLRLKQYRQQQFQLSYLSLLLVAVVIFSSSAESPTYVIAVTGIAIWLSLQTWPLKPLHKGLLVLLFLLTILSPTDLVPRFIRQQYIVQYALKALPCFVAWCLIVFQLLTKNYIETSLPPDEKESSPTGTHL